MSIANRIAQPDSKTKEMVSGTWQASVATCAPSALPVQRVCTSCTGDTGKSHVCPFCAEYARSEGTGYTPGASIPWVLALE